MWVLETVAVAFGMYSALPVPSFAWNEKNMRYALAAFPLVGVLLGLACWGWTALCAALAGWVFWLRDDAGRSVRAE